MSRPKGSKNKPKVQPEQKKEVIETNCSEVKPLEKEIITDEL